MTATIDNSMSPLSDLLQTIARRMAQNTDSPLVYVGDVSLPVAAPQATPISPELSVAWRALLGETGLAWQAEALKTTRQGAGVALMAPPPIGPTTLLLLLADQILAEAIEGVVVIVAPYAAALKDLAETLERLNTLLDGRLPYLVVDTRKRLPRVLPKILLTTPETVHQRLLRLHDRAWSRLWPQLAALVFPALDVSPGAKFGHIRWLLRRISRLRPSPRPPLLFASLAPVADDAETVAAMLDHLPPLVRVVSSRFPLTWALWHGGEQPIKAALDLALALRQNSVSVQLAGRTPLEQAIIRQHAADHGLPLMSLSAAPSTTLIIPGAPDVALLAGLAASGYRSVVLVLDQSVAAQTVVQHPHLLTPHSAPMLPVTLHNLYVDSSHIRCAAEERPLRQNEINDWEAHDLVERLERKNLLTSLAGTDTEWQPVAAFDTQQRDSYSLVHPASASGGVVTVADQDDLRFGEMDNAQAERCLYPGASILGAMVDRWADDATVIVKLQHAQRSMPEHRTTVTVREELAQRQLDGARGEVHIAVGRVLVREHIVARRVLQPDRSVRRIPFEPSIDLQWSAPAIWIPARDASSQLGELVVGVAPLLLRCEATDLVACLDTNYLYIAETYPGGRGLIEYLYAHIESLLHLVQLATEAVGDDPLLKGAAQAESAWLAQVLMPLGVDKVRQQPQPTQRPVQQPQVATSAEVTRRRIGRSRKRTTNRVITPHQATPPPVAPAQSNPQPAPIPRILPAPPKPQSTPAIARPSRRSETPEPPKRSKKTNKRRSGPSLNPPAPVQQRPVEPKPTEQPPQPADSHVLPTRREPPPYERPPYRDRQPQRDSRPSQPTPNREPARQPRRDEPRPAQRDTRRSNEPHQPQLTRQPEPRTTRPSERVEPPQIEVSSNPAELLAKARRLREQREAEAKRNQPSKPQPRPAAQRPEEPTESRFKAGDNVFCVPYGEGTVKKTRIRDGRELLLVQFAELGELRVDPQVNAVRLIESAAEKEEDD